MAYQFTAQDLLAVSMLGVPVGHYALHVLAQALAGLGIEPGSGPPQLFWEAPSVAFPQMASPVITPVRPLIDAWLTEDPANASADLEAPRR